MHKFFFFSSSCISNRNTLLYNHLFSSRLHWRNCSLLTSPCFHSRWRGQQHEDSNGILGGSRGHHRRHLHLFTTYLHKYIQIYTKYTNLFYSYSENSNRCTRRESRTAFSRWLPHGEIRDARTNSP